MSVHSNMHCSVFAYGLSGLGKGRNYGYVIMVEDCHIPQRLMNTAVSEIYCLHVVGLCGKTWRG